MKKRRSSPRRPRRALRLAILALLLGFEAVTLHPLLDGADLPAASARGDDRDGDKACAARKPAAEAVSAPVKRPSSPLLRRSVLALATPSAAASPLRPEREGELTNPAYLQIFLRSNLHSLRAPPA